MSERTRRNGNIFGEDNDVPFSPKRTVLPFDLILRDDDLAGVGVTGVGDGMAQDADHANHLTHFGDAIGNVAGVTDELLASGNL